MLIRIRLHRLGIHQHSLGWYGGFSASSRKEKVVCVAIGTVDGSNTGIQQIVGGLYHPRYDGGVR